jgi:hypothetical protein
MDVSPERLAEILTYDRDAGTLRWTVSRPKMGAGEIATRRGPKGTLVVAYNGSKLYAHRVAWALEHGANAIGHVIPTNGNFADIRITNLKEQARSDTLAGAKSRKTNSSGHKGVSRSSQSGRWIASITRNYQRFYLGEFDTKEEAAKAYAYAAAGNLPDDGRAQPLPRNPGQERRHRWIGQRRAKAAPMLAGFASYEAILAECGPPPSARHVLIRTDLNRELGPENAAWRLPYNQGGEKIKYHHAHLGATKDDFARFFEWQNGRCAICGEEEKQTFGGVSKEIALDHDPRVGVVRGLLCMPCNTALGLLKENAERLRAAIEYVENCGWVVGYPSDYCASCKQKVPESDGRMLALNYMGEPIGLLCIKCQKDGKFIKYQRALYRQYIARMGREQSKYEWPPGPDDLGKRGQGSAEQLYHDAVEYLDSTNVTPLRVPPNGSH